MASRCDRDGGVDLHAGMNLSTGFELLDHLKAPEPKVLEEGLWMWELECDWRIKINILMQDRKVLMCAIHPYFCVAKVSEYSYPIAFFNDFIQQSLEK